MYIFEALIKQIPKLNIKLSLRSFSKILQDRSEMFEVQYNQSKRYNAVEEYEIYYNHCTLDEAQIIITSPYGSLMIPL